MKTQVFLPRRKCRAYFKSLVVKMLIVSAEKYSCRFRVSRSAILLAIFGISLRSKPDSSIHSQAALNGKVKSV